MDNRHNMWKAIDRLSIIWKSDLTDKMKRSFFQAVVVSILLYGCTTWTLIKRLEKKLDSNYTRMLRAILNKSWRQHPTKHRLVQYCSQHSCVIAVQLLLQLFNQRPSSASIQQYRYDRCLEETEFHFFFEAMWFKI